MPDILEIDMNVREVKCSLCLRWTEWHWSVPTFNGDVVSSDFPDWLWGSGGGNQPVCMRCYIAHSLGEVPTFDRYYLHLDGMFIDGAGI